METLYTLAYVYAISSYLFMIGAMFIWWVNDGHLWSNAEHAIVACALVLSPLSIVAYLGATARGK